MLLGIHSREKKTSVHIKACTQLFIEASSDLVRLCGLKKKKTKKTQLFQLYHCLGKYLEEDLKKIHKMTLDLELKIEKDPFYLMIYSLRVEVPSSSFLYSLHFVLKCLMNERNKKALGIQCCGPLLGMCWKYVARRQNIVMETNFKVVAALLYCSLVVFVKY